MKDYQDIKVKFWRTFTSVYTEARRTVLLLFRLLTVYTGVWVVFVEWKPENNLSVPPQKLSTLVFETGPFIEVHWLDCHDRPAGCRNTPFSLCLLQMFLTPPGFFMWVLGPKLRYPWLCGKHFTDYTISLAHTHFYLFKCVLVCKIYFCYYNFSLFLRIPFMYTM